MFTELFVSPAKTPARPKRRHQLAAALVAVAAAISLSSLGPVSTDASASPLAAADMATTPAPTVVAGRDRVTVAWPTVQGASSYVVQVSTAKSVVRTLTTLSTSAVVAKLATSTVYFVQLSANTAAGTLTSARVRVKTASASPSRPVITSVAPAGLNAVTVTWTRTSPATSIDIRLSWDNLPLTANQKSRYTLFRGFPATATSATLQIPTAYLSTIGSTTGNATYVRVIAHNGSRERRSAVGYGWPSSLPAIGTQLKVATFNVASVAARPSGTFSWASKRTSVANAIKLAGPDVLMTQEAIPNAAWSGAGFTQLQDLSGLLSNSGMQLAYPVDRVQAIRGGSRGNHIFVRTDRIAVIDSGLVPSSELVSADWSKLENRYFAWAKLQVRDTGEYFYAVSVHLLSPDGTSSRKNLRFALVAAMDRYVSARNTENYPVVVGGDFNYGSHTLGAWDAPQYMLRLGYFDTASANSRSGATFNTTNPTFASRPRYHKYPESRIDYLFAKNTNGAGPLAYANQLVLNSNGTLNTSYYGSDHNLQWAVISLGQR